MSSISAINANATSSDNFKSKGELFNELCEYFNLRPEKIAQKGFLTFYPDQRLTKISEGEISETARNFKIVTCLLKDIPYEYRMHIDGMISSIHYLKESASFCPINEYLGNVCLGTSVIKDISINEEKNRVERITYEKEVKIYQNDVYYFLPVLFEDKKFIIMKIKKENLLVPESEVEVFENPLRLNPLEFDYVNGKPGTYNVEKIHIDNFKNISHILKY